MFDFTRQQDVKVIIQIDGRIEHVIIPTSYTIEQHVNPVHTIGGSFLREVCVGPTTCSIEGIIKESTVRDLIGDDATYKELDEQIGKLIKDVLKLQKKRAEQLKNEDDGREELKDKYLKEKR